jgi:hypothetical protein
MHLGSLERARLIKTYQKNGEPFLTVTELGKSADEDYQVVDAILPLLDFPEAPNVLVGQRFKILKFLNYDEKGKTLKEIEERIDIPRKLMRKYLRLMKGISYNKETGRYNTGPVPSNIRWSFFLNAIYDEIE